MLRGSAALTAVRADPGVALTSGCEEESLHSVWRAAKGLPVYTDPYRPPFSAAYFNWLFYRAYAGFVDRIGGLPADGRLLTMAFALAGAAGLYFLLARILPETRLVAAGLSALVWLGPLMGWWAHTVRPDTGALFFETAAVGLVLVCHRRHPLAAALAAGALFYAAWAFKQTFFLGLGTALLFLLVRRQWRAAFLLAGLSVAGWVATFALLGAEYRTIFQGTALGSAFALGLGLDNLRDMAVKSLPSILLVLTGTFGRQLSAPATTALATDARLLGGLGLLVTLPLVFVASCKLGAASNYYLPVLTMLTLYAAGHLAGRSASIPVLIAFAVATTLQLLPLLHLRGRLDLEQQNRELAAVWPRWRPEPEPRYSHLRSLNLPWLNPDSPPFVLAYNYGHDRNAGRPFEAGGVGGLIEAGFFRSLLLPAGTDASYDGGSLRHYRRGETFNGLTIFRRISPPTP